MRRAAGSFHPRFERIHIIAMTALLAPSTWPVPPGAGTWRFGRVIESRPSAPGVQWVLRRNCSISPRQLGLFYGSLCAVSLAIAAGFALHGAPVVLAFAGIELLLIGVAFLIYARHATDGDTLTLEQRELCVEQSAGATLRTTRFRAEWVAVEPSPDGGSLIELSGQGRRVRVGRFLRPELREAFARELRSALRVAREAPRYPHPQA